MSVYRETGWLEGRKRLAPDQIALVDGETGRRCSYDLLYRRSVRAARYLSEMGISKGDRVAFLAPNDRAVFVCFFACERLGAIFVPQNMRLSPRELNGIM
jgi:fatty-acyl-CoA synthase